MQVLVELIRSRKPCLTNEEIMFEAKWVASHAEIEIHDAASKLCKKCKECVCNGKSNNSRD